MPVEYQSSPLVGRRAGQEGPVRFRSLWGTRAALIGPLLLRVRMDLFAKGRSKLGHNRLRDTAGVGSSGS